MQLKEFVLNDILPGYIIAGKALIKPGVKEVKENSVLFNNVPKEEPIDIIVFATGNTFALPFLDETVVKVEDGQASLYKYIFPAHLQKPPLAVIGLIKPLASIISTSEVQARWAVRVLKGINKLPPSSVMIAEVNARKEKKPSGFGLCYCKALEVDYIPYIDELLTYINAKPNLFSMLLTDPRLGLWTPPFKPVACQCSNDSKSLNSDVTKVASQGSYSGKAVAGSWQQPSSNHTKAKSSEMAE